MVLRSPRARAGRCARRAAILLAAAGASLAVPVTPVAADTLLPPDGKVYVGLSGANPSGWFTRAAGKHAPVLQQFVVWGSRTSWAFRRAQAARSRPMLSISTGAIGHEQITPRAMALGRGDSFLLRLNAQVQDYGGPTYVRLMAEMNGHWNPYCAFSEDGRSRGPSHSTRMFRRAWQRAVLIVRGGDVSRINDRLRSLGLPAVRGRTGADTLPRVPVSFLWVPQTAGNPDVSANSPRAYWPGSEYVDWVGTDFYSKFLNYQGLQSFYDDFKDKPVAFGEWALWGSDDPDFVRDLFAWARSHPRVRMLVYNHGNVPNGPFVLRRYPKASRALRGILRSERYAAFAPELDPELAVPQPITPPQQGIDATAGRISGRVLVKPPEGGGFVRVAPGDAVPFGSVVDASQGAVQLFGAVGPRRTDVIAGTFSEGVFTGRQTRSGRRIDVLIARPATCPAPGSASASRLAPPDTNRVRARERHSRRGGFRTLAGYSSAAAIGTDWTTIERCTSTTTQVRQGVVRVLDLVTKRTTVVRAGRSYTAGG